MLGSFKARVTASLPLCQSMVEPVPIRSSMTAFNFGQALKPLRGTDCFSPKMTVFFSIFLPMTFSFGNRGLCAAVGDDAQVRQPPALKPCVYKERSGACHDFSVKRPPDAARPKIAEGSEDCEDGTSAAGCNLQGRRLQRGLAAEWLAVRREYAGSSS